LRQSETSPPFAPYGYRVHSAIFADDEPIFWMGGRLAYDLVEISNDPACLDKPGFWAVSSTFEGTWTCARFAMVVNSVLPPAGRSWRKLSKSWSSSLSRDAFIAYVEDIQFQISQGWVYQVCACRELSTAIYPDSSLLGLMHEMLAHNPAPYASYLRLPHIEIASASPELFFKRENDQVLSKPIKGTKRLDSDEMEFGLKDKAENIMIVDLIRNDLGRICQPGTVTVPRLLITEDHPGLTHLVSDVSGTLAANVHWTQISRAILPPGSVSGAPKSSAIVTIEDSEGQSRGPYCGALGWIEGNHALLSVAIRIFWSQHDGVLRFGTGAGITWDSDPAQEWEETQLKAEHLTAIAGGSIS
jgi:para-aminobenzoate synthetase component 1